jgi:LysR family transcriptional regulator for bpeEF and oprC
MTQSTLGLQPIIAFTETAKRGSFAEASREVGCTPSSLAKSVARLEAQLGVRLFHRTTRRVTLTDDGQRLFERCQRVVAELEQLRDEASGAREAPSGTLRIDMPVALGRIVMLPILARLADRHPQLAIDARFSDRYVDLVKEGIDVAIRTGPLEDSSLMARPFAQQELLLFASPSYLAAKGTPARLSDLPRHVAVTFRVPTTGRPRPWHFRSSGRNVTTAPPSRVFVDDGDAIVRAALLGMGIGQVPHYMVAEAITAGDLVELLPAFRPTPMQIAAVMPSTRLVPRRVRALLDLLEQGPVELGPILSRSVSAGLP